MSIEITAKFPQFPDDYEFDIGGLLVQNGKKLTLTDEQEQAFVARQEKAVKDYFQNSEQVKVTGTGKISTADAAKLYPQPEPPQHVVVVEEQAAALRAEEAQDEEGSDN